MDAATVFDAVVARFGDAVHGFAPAVDKDGPRDAFFLVRASSIAEVARFLRDEPALRFDFLANLTAIDWPKREVIEVVYHLVSYPHRHEIVMKTELPRLDPRVPSLAGLYKIANWLEREQYDLFGVVFEGHPDLRRLLMPDDWVGHPMRKDFREPKAYRGMPTSRPSPIELLHLYDQTHAPKPAPPAPKPDGGTT